METDTQSHTVYYIKLYQHLDRCLPDEGDLVLVHPGLQLQTGILSKRRNDETEDQCDADKHSRKNNLKDVFNSFMENKDKTVQKP